MMMVGVTVVQCSRLDFASMGGQRKKNKTVHFKGTSIAIKLQVMVCLSIGSGMGSEQ